MTNDEHSKTRRTLSYGLYHKQSGNLARHDPDVETYGNYFSLDVDGYEHMPILRSKDLARILYSTNFGADTYGHYGSARRGLPSLDEFEVLAFVEKGKYIAGVSEPVDYHASMKRVVMPAVRGDLKLNITRRFGMTPPHVRKRLFGPEYQDILSLDRPEFYILEPGDAELPATGDILLAEYILQRLAAIVPLPEDWPLKAELSEQDRPRYLLVTDAGDTLIENPELVDFDPAPSGTSPSP